MPGTVPLYRLYSKKGNNTSFSSSYAEATNYFINKCGFIYDNGYNGNYILGYVYDKPQPKALPLYRLWSKSGNNTSFTTSLTEAYKYISQWGFIYDYGQTSEIQGYLLPFE